MIDRSKLLTSVRNTAMAQGKSATAAYEAIKAAIVDWSDATPVKEVADAYKIGRLMDSLGYTAKQGESLLLAPPKATDSDQKRWLAYRAAVSSWSSARLHAGAPVTNKSGVSGEPIKRKTRGKLEGGTPEAPKLPDNLQPAIVKATTQADMQTYALLMASNISKFQKLNAALCEGEVGDWLRNAPAYIRKAVKADQGKVTTGEPAAPKHVVALAA